MVSHASHHQDLSLEIPGLMVPDPLVKPVAETASDVFEKVTVSGSLGQPETDLRAPHDLGQGPQKRNSDLHRLSLPALHVRMTVFFLRISTRASALFTN